MAKKGATMIRKKHSDLLAEFSPTLQGHTTYLPASELEDLEVESGVPRFKFGRLTVSENASHLFNAIRVYLSFSPVPSDQEQVPLEVQSCFHTKDDDVSHEKSGNSSFSADDSCESLPASCVNSETVPPARPVYKLAASKVTLVWPPPPHLTAESLLNLKNANPSRTLHRALIDEGLHYADFEDDVDRTNIYLFYYRVGNPISVQENPKVMHEMVLVSERGMNPLLCFAEEVIEWNQRLQKAPDLQSRFPLFRFKIEFEEGTWVREGLKRARLADSVVLAGDLMDRILREVQNFRNPETRDWYLKHGLPYRRSLLFFGPPGTGKTSTIRVIASKFKLSCYVLSMANNSFSNQLLGDALSTIDSNALLVLEDVDALFNEDRSNKLESQLTFSGLLNALDGMGSVEGLITIMTTNHLDKLERALIRGGRVDRKFRFDLPEDGQLLKLFRSFYPDCSKECLEKFVGKVSEHRGNDEARAMCTLQQLFIEMREKGPEECVAGMDTFFKQHFPEEDKKLSYMI